MSRIKDVSADRYEIGITHNIEHVEFGLLMVCLAPDSDGADISDRQLRATSGLTDTERRALAWLKRDAQPYRLSDGRRWASDRRRLSPTPGPRQAPPRYRSPSQARPCSSWTALDA